MIEYAMGWWGWFSSDSDRVAYTAIALNLISVYFSMRANHHARYLQDVRERAEMRARQRRGEDTEVVNGG